MTLRWCVLTGAMMLAFVYATFQIKHNVENPPGVYTRWYDGTTERIDIFYEDGTLKSTTTFGDDGKTVIVLAELNPQGAIVHSKVRRQDGTVDEKRYSRDGKILALETVWNGDETATLSERQFYDDGKLHSVETSTANGAITTSLQIYDEDGQLTMDRHIMSNADQDTKEYTDGKLTEHSVFKANGDQVHEFFYAGTETVSRRQTVIALTKDVTIDFFDRQGILVYSTTRSKSPVKIVNSAYVHGKIAVRQTGGPTFQLNQVEQFDTVTGKPLRKIEVNDLGQVTATYSYRMNGTLLNVKHLQNGLVTSQDNYDESGGKIISTTAGGAAESIDRHVLEPILPPQEQLPGQDEEEDQP